MRRICGRTKVFHGDAIRQLDAELGHLRGHEEHSKGANRLSLIETVDPQITYGSFGA